jgi:hypothetical protein
MQSAAKVADKTDRQLAMAQNFQRKARFYLDFVETENSTAFPHRRRPRGFSASPLIFARRQGRVVNSNG